MIKNITFGQFFPGNSVIHKLDPRTKLILTLALIIMIFLCFNFYSLGLMFLTVIILVAISKIPFSIILKSLKPIFIVVLFTSALNIIYTPGEDIIVSFWKITITWEGVYTAIFTVIRIVSLVVVSSLLTYTTSPTSITDGIEKIFHPIKFLRSKVHIVAMMMTIALRFIPTLVEEIDKITSAQKARGADIDSGGLIRRAKALIPIFVPLFVTSFRRAYELAFAMECRCYTGGEGRTKMKQLKFALGDLFALIVVLLLIGGIVALNIFFEKVI